MAALAPALRGERKPAHTHAVGLENDDAPFGEIGLHRWHVREEERDLIKPLGDGRRQGLVDQEPQPAVASGSSRSRTASAA